MTTYGSHAMFRNILATTAAIFVLLTPVSFAQEIKLSAKADPLVVAPGASFSFIVTVAGEGLQSAPDPAPPRLKTFEIVGRSSSKTVSIINFAMTTTKTVTYQILVPPDAKEGRYEIPVTTLTYKNKTYRANPVAITVDKNAPPGRSPRTARRRGFFSSPGLNDDPFFNQGHKIKKDDLIVTLDTDKKEVALYEPVIATFSFFRRVALWSQPSFEKPDFKGFWVEELPYPGGRIQQNAKVVKNGKEYQVTTFRYALIPLAVGNIQIEPARLVVSLGPGSGVRDMRTDPKNVLVSPPPDEGKPPSFTGMVGRYSLTFSTEPSTTKSGGEASALSLRVNDSVTLTITITGYGYLKPVPPPSKPVVDGFEVFDPTVTDNLDKSDGRMSSTRTIEIPMIAKEEGVKVIGAMVFSWYDPSTKKYLTSETETINVIITPALRGAASPKAGVKQIAEDIRYIKPDQEALDDWSTPPHLNWWFWTLVITPVVVFPVAFLVARRRRAKFADSSWVRARAAAKSARKKLDEAAAASDQKEFFAIIDQALRGYLGDVWDIPSPSVTKELASRRMDGEFGISTQKLFDTIELARYAQVKADEWKNVASQVEEVIDKMERSR